jgi:large subunit ribosomal protein L1
MAEAVANKPAAKAKVEEKTKTDERIVRSKRYKEAAKKQIEQAVPIEAAVEILKAYKPTKFDQTVELIFKLGIDAKQDDQRIRTSLSLPHGIGKAKKVIAFCPENLIPAANEAGAIKAGGQALVEEIEKTNFTDFDVAIATPDMMRFVGKLGKVLGPKGLMPSPKAGTVAADIASAVREFAAGKMEIRNDDGGNVHTVVGKLSFDSKKLAENAASMIASIRKLKPNAAKGVYIQKVVLKSTMSPAVYVKVDN